MTIFSISDNDLLILNQFQVVEFFRLLLWAEAEHYGISLSLIDVPMCINVSDGGLDAFIENTKVIENSLIPNGLSGYQIKKSNLGPKECKKELYNDKERKKLKPRIQDLINKNGTYVLVIFQMLTETTKKRKLEAIIEELKKFVKEPKVKIYDTTFLLGFIKKYPALITYLKPIFQKAQFYNDWALNQDVSYPKNYVWDNNRGDLKVEIRRLLRESKTRIICIEGLFGLGKTRFVFEVLKVDDLKSITLYYSSGTNFNSSGFFNQIKDVIDLNCIFVIDNCNIEDLYNIMKYFSKVPKQARFIVLTQKSEDYNIGYKNYKFTRLDSKSLREILDLETPDMLEEIKIKIIDLSHGFPYILSQLMRQYENNPKSMESDARLLIDGDFLIKKLICMESITNKENYSKIKKILLYMALFSNIGFSGDLTDYVMKTSIDLHIPMFYTNFADRFEKLSIESKWLADYLQIDWIDFKTIITELKKLGIIEGNFFINISIFPLIKILLKKWWIDSYNETIDMISSIPKNLRDSLINRFFFNLNFVNLSYHEVYDNIIKFFYNLIENDEFKNHILNFVINNYQFIKSVDKKYMIFELIGDEEIRKIFITKLIFSEIFSLKKFEIKNWFKRLFKEDKFIKNIVEMSYVYRFFINNDLLNYLIFKIIDLLENKELYENVIGIMLFRYNDLCAELKIEFNDLISNFSNELIVSRLLLIHFMDISPEIRIEIYDKLLNKQGSGFNLLLNILFLYCNKFPEIYREKVLSHLSKFKDLIPFLSLMLVNYWDLLNYNLKKQMINTISSGNSERDLAYRNLLNRTIKMPEDFKKLLNIGKIKKKITNKENEIIENNNDYIYNILKLLEFHASIYKTWREKYKPQKVKLLFITEGITPNMENRLLYFYNPFNTQSNELFNYLMASIFPNYNKKCSPTLRANYLDRLIKKGYYLEDVFPLYDDSVNKELNLKIWIDKELEKGLELLINKHTPIIIIKEDLFNILKSKLITLGYSNIYRKAIPFPNINLHTFKEKVRNAMIDLNLV